MSLFQHLLEYIKRDQEVALVTVVRGPAAMLGTKAVIPMDEPATGSLLDSPLAAEIERDARDCIARRKSTTRSYPLHPDPATPEIEVFFEIHNSAPRLIIVGAVHIASDLIHYAKPLGLRTYLVDPRSAFATPERFPHVDEMIHAWPDEALETIGITRQTSVVVVTHDPKLDDPALQIALPSLAQYVGALGSPKTHAQRIKRLLAEGVAQAHLDRLHAPIGLNIGGRTPAEIALSIIAEIVAVRNNVPVMQPDRSND